MANKHTKRCSTPLISKEMQIKTTVRYHPTFLRMAAIKKQNRDFFSGPVVKNLPPNAGEVGSIPGRGTKIPQATGQLSRSTTTGEKPVRCN